MRFSLLVLLIAAAVAVSAAPAPSRLGDGMRIGSPKDNNAGGQIGARPRFAPRSRLGTGRRINDKDDNAGGQIGDKLRKNA